MFVFFLILFFYVYFHFITRIWKVKINKKSEKRTFRILKSRKY